MPTGNPRLRILLLAVLLGARFLPHATATPVVPPARVELPGHVLPALARATAVPAALDADAAPITLTLVLRRDDQAGFERYLRDVYDAASPRHRRFLGPRELSDRFGPSADAYERVLGHLRAAGFELVDGSANRLTLTVRGTRAAAERAFAVHIGDYRVGDRDFFANADEPTLPPALAPHVQTIAGLANLAQPRPSSRSIAIAWAAVVCQIGRYPIPPPVYCRVCNDGLNKAYNACLTAVRNAINSNAPIDWDTILYATSVTTSDIVCSTPGFPPPLCPSAASAAAVTPAGAGGAGVVEADGTGQTVGIVGFDTFVRSDIEDYLALVGLPASRIDALSRVPVNGGATLGPDQDEVLLDVTTVMTVAQAADVVVFDAPFSGGASFQALFNAAINAGVDVISNSWAYCEDQTSLADVQGIDAVLQSAAASNISVFNAAGDSGSTCLDGSPNTVAVPADSPNATAVGGSTVTSGDGKGWLSERWWDGTSATPPTGQGGFGVSRFFTRPSYQDGLTTSPTRSVPDVVASADPAGGVMICQASAGGCPTGALYGGTSFSAPLWAANTAVLNDALGENVGFMNAALYPLAGTSAFHAAADLASDFAHVGLGSLNLDGLYLQLSGTAVGPADADASNVSPVIQTQAIAFEMAVTVPADGASEGFILVTLLDVDRHAIAGKTISLAANAGSSVTIAPATAVTDAYGQASFTVTNLVAEDVTFTGTDTTDGLVLTDTPTLTFEVPTAAAAGIVGLPAEVTANGVSTATITVTLEDAFGRPTPNKKVQLSQGDGHAQITAPASGVTDAEGKIAFTVTNKVSETVTFTAVDVTDDLPVPGSAVVSFIDGAVGACGSGDPPVGENGNVVTPWAAGFFAEPFFYGNVNWGGCPGGSNPTFSGLRGYVADFRTGQLFDMGLGGGAASSDRVIFQHAPTLGQPTFGKDGKLYATFAVTTGNYFTGAIVELDPVTGGTIRTVASNLTCPGGLSVDPLSGDLFFDGSCTGAGSDDNRIRRVVDPGGTTPTVVDYATLPATPNAALSFAPDGTLYAATGYFDNLNTPIVSVTGTNTPNPGVVTTVPGVTTAYGAMAVAEALPSGAAKSLFIVKDGDLMVVDITTDPPTSTLMASNFGPGTIGPDGCMYTSTGVNIYKLATPGGACPFSPTNPGPSLALAPDDSQPSQGSEQTLTATFRNVDVPEDTPVFFEVSGVNPRVQMVRTNAAGEAVFRYTGVATGLDLVEAAATVDGEQLASNRATVFWTDGEHVTALTLNPSPLGGAPGQAVEVVAALVDTTVQPNTPINGKTVGFTLGAATCTGTTDTSGLARCQLTPAAAGTRTLVATFAGTAGAFTPSSDRAAFSVLVSNGGGSLRDAFVAYSAKTSKGSTALPKIGPVQLDDGVGNGGYDLQKLGTLANPAAVDGSEVADAARHLVGYPAKRASGSAKFTPATLQLTSVCGTTSATLKKPTTLYVPSGEDPSSAVTVPSDDVVTVQHYLCYQAKGPKVAKGTQVVVADQQGSFRYDLKKVSLVCNPTAKSGDPVIRSGKTKGEPYPITPAIVGDPDGHLVCYGAKLAKKEIAQQDGGCGPANPKDKGTKIKQGKPAALRGTNIANQLQTGQLDTKKPTLVCLPAS